MTRTEIKSWIKYWAAARMVNFAEIKSISDVAEARKWCACTRVGLFSNVSDASIWNALKSVRFDEISKSNRVHRRKLRRCSVPL